MKHLRILLPLLVLALVLSACGKQSLEPYTYTYSTLKGEKTITVNPENQTILDGNVAYSYKATKSGSGTDYEIIYPNGGTYWWMSTDFGGHGGWSEDYDENTYISGNILIHAIQQNQPRERKGNAGIGLLLMGLGAVNFFIPELPFYLRYGWAVRDAEPSDAYIAWAKIGGVLAAVVGVIQLVI